MLSKEEENIIIDTLKPFNPTFIGLFGSYARNEETETSDIDILYDFENKYSLFDLIELKELLYERLNKKVDLVSLKYIKPYFKKYILDDLVYLLNEKNKQVIS
ncbi:MAG: nucleotidyltransferase [Bacteroidetes bacterium]|nr:nucleotidyltransferase [Bacteroidota bacterium]